MAHVPALWIFLGLVGGLALGLALAFAAPAALPPILAVAGPVGDLWLRALRATIMPLVVALLFTGVVQTVAAARAGAMARRALAWFMVVLVGGSAMAGLFTPTLLALVPIPQGAGAALRANVDAAAAGTATTMPAFGDFITSMVPVNVFTSAAADAVLPVILFTGVFAMAATRLRSAQRQSLTVFFEGIAGAMLVVIGWVLWCGPVAFSP